MLSSILYRSHRVSSKQLQSRLPPRKLSRMMIRKRIKPSSCSQRCHLQHRRYHHLGATQSERHDKQLHLSPLWNLSGQLPGNAWWLSRFLLGIEQTSRLTTTRSNRMQNASNLDPQHRLPILLPFWDTLCSPLAFLKPSAQLDSHLNGQNGRRQ
jgi:hypothetical protein